MNPRLAASLNPSPIVDVAFVFGGGDIDIGIFDPGTAEFDGLALPLGTPPTELGTPGVGEAMGFGPPISILPGFVGEPMLIIGVPLSGERKGFPFPSTHEFFDPCEELNFVVDSPFNLITV